MKAICPLFFCIAASCATVQEPTPAPAPPPQQSEKSLRLEKPKPKTTKVDLERFLAIYTGENPLIIDVRPKWFYQAGHIKGAFNMPLKAISDAHKNLEEELKLAKTGGDKIVLYCTNIDCPDSARAARFLVNKGYRPYIYEGGWEEWERMGMETE